MLKSRSSWRHVVTAAALLGVSCFSPSLWAQESMNTTTASPSPLDLSRTRGHQRFEELAPGTVTQVLIPLRNIKASLAAYWLDPANHPAPIDLQISMSLAGEYPYQRNNGENPYLRNNGTNPYLPHNKEEPRLPGHGKGPVGLKLPEGITRIVAVDPQNALIAFGTKEGLQALNALIPTIDVPLRQYEIEAQFLQISRADLPQLGLTFEKPIEQSPYQFGSVAKLGNFQAPMQSLIAHGRAKVLTAPRVTVIDGLTGQLEQTTSIPFTFDIGGKNQQVPSAPNPEIKPPGPGSTSSLPPNVAVVRTSIGIRVTAAQVKDKLISLSITPTLGTRTISVTANVRDGESFAIQLSPAKDKQQVVVLVTTRQLRRVGDDDAQAN